jgi:enoyl-CoA hydratase/carnithine racemase
MGGGAEMLVNLDLAVAGQSATLGFPEAKRGVTVGAGGIPRLVRLVGHIRGKPGTRCSDSRVVDQYRMQ